MYDMIYEVLIDIFDEKRNLFPINITNHEQICKFYQSVRTFWRSSDTRAIERKVLSADIDVVNQWQMVKKGGGKRPAYKMK